MLVRTPYPDRETWLEGRMDGIGASEAAAVVWAHPWMKGGAKELYELKTGMKRKQDVSSVEAVERGNRLEPVLRELYAVNNPEKKVEYHQFDTLAQSERPWLFATLDGEIIDTNSRHGILEIKTASCTKKADWDKWRMQIPRHYYIQILHQLLATGFDFVNLFACLIDLDNDQTIRTYHFERSELKDDLEWLLGEEDAFWKRVQTRVPPVPLITF